jgi:PKD repeat protein
MPLASMRLSLCLILIAILVLAHPAACNEIAYAIGPNGEKPVGQANITDYKGTDVVTFTTSASPQGSSTTYKSQRTVGSIKNEIDKKINRGNELVRENGLRLARGRSGAQRIDQVCSIYDYMVGNWSFVSDWKGLNEFQYSNYTLKMGQEGGYSGEGDCDDFSILLASLVESVGGTPRVIFAYSPTAGGHAYTEVYLGKKDDKDVDRMLKWLRTAYNVDDINIHENSSNGDLWLNMDWWKDPGGANHPGGPFYQAATQVPIETQEDVPKAPLTPIENKLPRALFNYSPLQPEVDELVSFDASGSNDPDGKIVDYKWDFGDGETAHGITKSACRHSYSSSGEFPVNLTVTDNDGDKNTKTLEINVKEPLPVAIITYSPINPQVGEAITFDASQSRDKRGQITEYKWDFDDGNMGYKATMKHRYEDSGAYNVNLTVTNDRGIKNSSSIIVAVSQKVETAGVTSTPLPAPIPENKAIAGVANENATDKYNNGVALYSQGKYDEAIIAFDETIKLDPTNATAWNSKGLALSSQGKYDEAIIAFDEAIKIDPKYSWPWNNKGWILYSQGKYGEAIVAFDEAIKLDPTNAMAWNNKGLALYSQGKYDEAIIAFDEAIKLDPKYSWPWYNKGNALNSQGKYNEALSAWAKAIELVTNTVNTVEPSNIGNNAPGNNAPAAASAFAFAKTNAI